MSCLVDIREAGNVAPVVILTGSGDEQFAAEAIRGGATDYLPKNDLTPQLVDHCLRGAICYHQAQEQVRSAREALNLRDRAIAAASNGIVICDPHQPDCPIVYVNPAFSAITGYSPEESLGRNCRFLQGKDTDDINDLSSSCGKMRMACGTEENLSDLQPIWFMVGNRFGFKRLIVLGSAVAHFAVQTTEAFGSPRSSDAGPGCRRPR